MNKDSEIISEEINQDNKEKISVPCSVIVYEIAMPIIPLGFALYYFSKGEKEAALASLKFALIGIGIGIIGTIIYLLAKYF